MRILYLHRVNKRGQHLIERAKLSAEALSHEMRAPLASIIMIVDILVNKNQIPLKMKKQRKNL